MSASFSTVANAPFGSRPTGELGVMSGLGNPIPYPTLPNQQVNVGDIMVQADDNNYGMLALPAVAVPQSATNYASTLASQKALQQIHGAALEAGQDSGGSAYGFLGLAMGYKDPNNGSTPTLGGSANSISIAPRGRAKMRISPNDYNFASALPAGTLIGPAINVNGSTAGAFVPTALAGYVQSTLLSGGTTSGAQTVAATAVSTPLTASEAVGRLAFDKGANDAFVWVDVISTILEGGVQNSLTTG